MVSSTPPRRRHLFEIYRDQQAFAANAEAPWFAEYMAAAGPLLAAEPLEVIP